MSGFALSRRSMIGAGLSGAALAMLGDFPGLAQSDVRLRMFWWGAKERAERTEKVNQLYQQSHAGLSIAGESLGWTDYWPRRRFAGPRCSRWRWACRHWAGIPRRSSSRGS